jgi:hypothetical protein
MDLLPQSTIKEQKKDAREIEIFRKISLARAATEKAKTKDEVAKAIEAEKERGAKEIAKLRARTEQKKSELLGEIVALEAKRDRVMEPFYTIKFEAQEMMTMAESYEKRVKSMAKEVNAKADTVDQKRKELDDREAMLAAKERSIASRELSVIEEEARVASDQAALQRERSTFEIESQATLLKLETKDSDLKKREAEIEAKLEIIKAAENEIAIERAQVKDQRETLERGFAELRSKQ